MSARDKYYFISDVHLGVPVCDKREHEMKFVSFLDSIEADAKEIYLLGDIFDFWYEYKYVIPKGYIRTLGRLAALADEGVKIYFFPGNHDVWAYGYFEEELGIKILNQPYLTEIEGKSFCIGHGDGLGKTDVGFKFVRWMFHNRFLQILFSALHPRWAFGIGYTWAKHSYQSKNRKSDGKEKAKESAKSLFQFVRNFDRKQVEEKGGGIDYYIFGHYHIPGITDLPDGGKLFMLGEWIKGCEYAIFDGNSLTMKQYV